jgi:hypothetical protein
MKKIFITGFFLLVQHICAASDSDFDNEGSELSKTHKVEYIKETGETVFYPQEYDNYHDLTKEYIINLLFERLEILFNIRSLGKSGTDFYKAFLNRNEIVLMNNLDDNGISSVFGKTYDNQDIQVGHIINISNYLKSMFPDDKSVQEELDKLIEKFVPSNEGASSAPEKVSQPNPENAAGF